MSNSLKQYLEKWNDIYIEKAKVLPIFKSEITRNWNQNQKEYFVKVFYHVRGHFHDFLWYLGNHTDDKKVKDIILENISEELNSSSLSHEQLYEEFAKSLGVNLESEYLKEENYRQEIRQFNNGHIKWLHNNCPNTGFAAFSAYERLDNIDYINLLELAKNLGVTGKGLLFFKVHTRVEHFETTYPKLKEIWDNDPQKVFSSFEFICNHQVKLWDDLEKIISQH
ncbi:MAG: iron-containing redox enzyme family protein [Janthinobacterium lividum]